MFLAERNRGLGLPGVSAKFLTDSERLLKVAEGLGSATGQVRTQLIERQASPRRLATLCTLPMAMRCMVTHSAELLRRLKQGESAKPQAVSWKPAAAAGAQRRRGGPPTSYRPVPRPRRQTQAQGRLRDWFAGYLVTVRRNRAGGGFCGV